MAHIEAALSLFLQSLFCYFCVCICATSNALHAVEKTPLKFSYITTKTGGFVSSGSIPVVDLALEQINNSTDILGGYTLNYTAILDSKVSHNNNNKLLSIISTAIKYSLSPLKLLSVQSYSIIRCFYGSLSR